MSETVEENANQIHIEAEPGGVTAAKGFYAASCAAGIKYAGRQDMALIYSDAPCSYGGVFTRNVVKAAPVVWDREILASGGCVRAVVVNAGIANACTGAEGYGYCKETAASAARALNQGITGDGIPVADHRGEKWPVDTAGAPGRAATAGGSDAMGWASQDTAMVMPSQVLVASTGVIGKQLPMERIRAGVEMLVGGLETGPEAGNLAAKAIMTTDTVEKEAAATVDIGGKPVRVGGMCKGSGMIHPDMCTMLAFVTTDADISPALLQEALAADVQDTFNMVSVDGDTSTNDTLVVLANGRAGNQPIVEKGEDYLRFCAALHYVNETLAKKIAGDGEGCTALFEVKVVGAADKAQAATLAKSVIGSSLTKAAIFGHDANWGRILCAMGYSGAQFDPETVDLWFESAAGKLQIVENSVACDYSEETATQILSCPAVTAIIDIKAGDARATAWGCDLTYDYVKINADYRS
ncbi:MAG: bifunctional glutamate N-acetyltransferase/amino-acid acetyltransferase ArgJ [Lachnospiraceae bacterium]|jgi:glutamate N-acetyltransferase/amino-acid N-acetyltransferase|nr:bifunctional glutamate N-acetyltransferase/amino-acid acetyltransferase ArgJ [Lachnospiraceae bacterium]